MTPSKNPINQKAFFQKVLCVFFLFFTSVRADYREQFNGQLGQEDFPGMEKTLSDWKLSTPDDLEWLVACGNYHYQKGLTGAGSQETLQAYPYWRQALQSNPWRLDIDFDLARLYQSLDQFENQYNFLAQTLLFADKGWRHLQWAGNAKLPKRSSRLIPETLQVYIEHYFGQNTQEGDEKALRLARLSATFYPHRSQTYHAMATYYSRRKDWPHTLEYLLRANHVNPKDSRVLQEIGDTLVELGKKKEARIFYQKAVDLNPPGKPGEKTEEKQADAE
ncbi:MAG TPA: tetratricopeptide repeat protein [bacterium]|nr:tetratricopeptide repeat protein [bacterium]